MAEPDPPFREPASDGVWRAPQIFLRGLTCNGGIRRGEAGGRIHAGSTVDLAEALLRSRCSWLPASSPDAPRATAKPEIHAIEFPGGELRLAGCPPRSSGARGARTSTLLAATTCDQFDHMPMRATELPGAQQSTSPKSQLRPDAALNATRSARSPGRRGQRRHGPRTSRSTPRPLHAHSLTSARHD